MSLPLGPPFTTRPAVRSDIPDIVRLSIRTFKDSEPKNIIIPRAEQYPEENVQFQLNRYYNRLIKPATKITVVENEKHEVVAYSVWDAEGDTHVATTWKRENAESHSSLWSMTEPYYLKLQHYYQRYVSLHCVDWLGLAGLVKEAERVFQNEPSRCLHLDVLLVHPSYQGKGIGKNLLLWGLGVAREAGLPVKLESTRAGRPLYEKCGFDTVGYLVVERYEEFKIAGMVWKPL